MRETDLQAKFLRLVKKRIPNYFYYKIPDTKGLGNRKPFDAFIISGGLFFALEFKLDFRTITEYQDYCATKVMESGCSHIYVLPSNVDATVSDIKMKIRSYKNGPPN